MRIIVLPVGRCRFLEENESGLRFRGTKKRRFIIDPLVPIQNSGLSVTVTNWIIALGCMHH